MERRNPYHLKRPTLTREQVELALRMKGGRMGAAADSIPMSRYQFRRYVDHYGLRPQRDAIKDAWFRSVYRAHNGDLRRIARSLGQTVRYLRNKARALGLLPRTRLRITITRAEAQAAVAQYGSVYAASQALGIKHSGFRYVLYRRKRDNEVSNETTNIDP
jgi:DNA-binding NtrC family response regulator